MAAIDKLWLKDYDDLASLRQWALVYYPKLFLWLDIFYTRESFERDKQEKALWNKERADEYWKDISSDGSIYAAIACLRDQGYSEELATEMAYEARADYVCSLREFYDKADLSVMNAPFSVDKKLKWICPLHCVREYLQEQCGVKEHWYYKLFWRGKKYFEYL